MIPLLGEAAIAIGASLALSLIVKATIVSIAALTAVRMASRAPASVRHLLLSSGFAVLLALPVATLIVPALELGVPIASPVLAVPNTTPATVNVTLPAVSSRDEAGVSPVVPARRFMSFGMVLLIAWIIGVATVLARMVADMLWVRRVRSQARPWSRGQAIVADIPGSSSIRRRVRILLDDTAVGPITCGVFRPAIVLPREACEWDAEELRRAVIHELEHVRRADLLMLCVARIVCALYWFHPLVWMSWRQLRLEAERACDDAVLRGVEPVEYADQLVTLAERLVSRRIESVPAMADRTDLAVRISAVLDPQQRRGRAGFRVVSFVSMVAFLLVAAVSSLRAVPQSQSLDSATQARFEAAAFAPAVLDDVGRIAPASATAPAPGAVPRSAAVAVPTLPRRITSAAAAPPIPAEQQPPTPAAPVQQPPLPAAQAPTVNSPARETYNSPANVTLGDRKFTRSQSSVDSALERRLEEALKAGSAPDRLFLTADASFNRLNRAEYRVPVTIRIAPGRELQAGRGDVLRLEFVGVIQDAPYGVTLVRMVDAFELALDAEARDALATTPIVYQGAFVLLPGRYRIRVLVRDQATDRIGVIDVPFFVPNLNRAK
jgi:beta-lactamase regulating signal transducer with metallopeptidase domain